MGTLMLVLGGARSGKSNYAERIALQGDRSVLYIATAQALDEEMQTRIAAHKRRRSTRWTTLELPSGIGRHLLQNQPEADVVIIDCLTLLVSNLMLKAGKDLDKPDESTANIAVQDEITELLKAMQDGQAHWIVVSNEVGQGVVPPYPTGRLFRDLLGRSNQRLAERADEVVWMVAGIPIPIGQYRNTGI